jgi:hypothetical protein
VHRPAVPGHILRQAHVDRQQAAGPPVCDRQLRSSPRPGRVTHHCHKTMRRTRRPGRSAGQR